MKIFVFCQQLEFLGGIERVVIEQLRIFGEQHIDVTLLVDRPVVLMAGEVKAPIACLSAEESNRRDQLRTLLSEKRPEYIIFHGVSHQHAQSDIAIANESGVKSICVVHFAFPGNVALDGRGNSWKVFRENGAGCTAFATVSRIDSLWWRALGMRAFHVQNPFVKPKNADLSRRTGEDGTTNLIWVGRQAEQKQPSAALAAFARVYAVEPKTRLMMIGGSATGWDSYRAKAKRLGCLDAVEFISERPDLDECWAKADIHLLTSVCESFCLVWAEAKAAGIPTVMYELPYLELSEDPRGFIAVEQRNVAAFADAVLVLVRDKFRAKRMGDEAKLSLARFNDEAVWNSWKKLFESLGTEGSGREVPDDFKTVVTQIYSAYAFRKEKHQWEENMVEDFRKLTHCSMFHFARIMSKLVDWLRVAKRILCE